MVSTYNERISGGAVGDVVGGPADHRVDRSAPNPLWNLWVARSIGRHMNREFYLSQVSGNGRIVNPALHYVQEGADLGLDPCPEFSTDFYRHSNLDVLRSGVNPFWHYIKYGRKEGRVPKPTRVRDQSRGKSDDPEGHLSLLAGHFDVTFYRASYSDLPQNDEDLPSHYLSVGWLLGNDPNDWFSSRDYLRANPDVAEARSNPFIHYLRHGLEERRPLTKELANAENRLAAIQSAIATISEEFDADFYLSQYRDVADAGVDPVLHYCAEGYREGRDPCPGFSTEYYGQSNPDVVEAGLNPFVHYISIGRAEGRFPRHPAARELGILERHDSLDSVVREWRRPEEIPRLVEESALEKLLSKTIGTGQLVLSISHDNYLLIAGGVQLCIHNEELLVRERGDTYLAVFPWQALPRLAHSDETPDVLVALALNGENIGVVRTSLLTSVIRTLTGKGCTAKPVIHQILGHSPEQIVDMVLACGRKDCVMWLHDFVTLCPKFSLQRNDLAFCGAPDVDSNACAVCLYGEERRSHLDRVGRMFDELDVHMVSPSVAARAFWNSRRTIEPNSITVRPHMKLTSVKRTGDARERKKENPVRIAYLGAPMAHKGWNEFLTTADAMDGPNYEFFHFAKEDTVHTSVRFVAVHVKAGEGNAMVEALSEHDIDLVLHWASWPETFSFTTFEAILAGAFVLTNEGSGNVAAAVRKHRRGCVLEDLDALRELFADSERLDQLVATRREASDRTEFKCRTSTMSIAELDWLGA